MSQKGGRAFLREAAGQGIKGDDAILVPRRMDESRGIQLVNSFAFGSSATTDMRKQAYLEMLPEIDKIAASTKSWHAECYRIGALAELVDKEIGRTTCKYYQYRPRQ
jgi:hypothetical protein